MRISELAYHGLLQADIKAKGTKPVDDDEDIFGDAGTNYTPKLPVPKAANGHAPAPSAGSYFDKEDEMTDLPALPKAGHFCFCTSQSKPKPYLPALSLQVLIAWGRW